MRAHLAGCLSALADHMDLEAFGHELRAMHFTWPGAPRPSWSEVQRRAWHKGGGIGCREWAAMFRRWAARVSP